MTTLREQFEQFSSKTILLLEKQSAMIVAQNKLIGDISSKNEEMYSLLSQEVPGQAPAGEGASTHFKSMI